MREHEKLLWGLGLALLIASPLAANGRAERRPISAFVNVQKGTVGGLDPESPSYLSFDAFGKTVPLGDETTFEGSVTVRELADGRAHVLVILLTTNAACWGFDTGTWSPAFGYLPREVREGATPSLGDGLFRAEFTMPALTTPLPTYGQLFTAGSGYVLLRLETMVNCRGVLREASGFPDGTPGAARTTQIYMPLTGGPAGCAAGDCWPSEKVVFWPTGPR
jgi:hypothetical protein